MFLRNTYLLAVIADVCIASKLEKLEVYSPCVKVTVVLEHKVQLLVNKLEILTWKSSVI